MPLQIAVTLALGGNGGLGSACVGANGEGGTEGGAPGKPHLQLPTEGLFGCPTAQACTLLVVSQSLDDRVEVFTLDGEGPTYRGAFAVDFDPNPAGDIGNEALDEPFEFVGFGQGFVLAVGHFPERARGSLFEARFDHFASTTVGQIAPTSLLGDNAGSADGVTQHPLQAREAIHLLAHRSGRVLISAFENDLFDAPTTWTQPGSLTLLEPSTGRMATRSLDSFDNEACAGAWRAVELADREHIALACDGEAAGALIVDTTSLELEDLDAAAEGLVGCMAGLSSQGRQTRYLAPAPGGVLIADSSRANDQSAGVLWSFNSECELLGAAQWDGPTLWDFRGLETYPANEQRWALLNARGSEAGVHIVDDTGQSCRRFDELDALMPADHEMLALRWSATGDAFVVSAGPREPLDAVGAQGGLWRVRFDSTGDPCTLPIAGIDDFLAEAPPFDPDDPDTWRRAGAALHVLDYGPQQ